MSQNYYGTIKQTDVTGELVMMMMMKKKMMMTLLLLCFAFT